MTRIYNLYEDFSEWEELLSEAEENAYKDNDVRFVEDMKTKTEQYGINTYCSSSQHDRLLKLAGRL